jgi:hypothetical protein
LEWLNNQGQFLAEIDQNIDSFQTQLQSLDSRILAINPYDAEVVVVTKKLDVSYVQNSNGSFLTVMTLMIHGIEIICEFVCRDLEMRSVMQIRPLESSVPN